MGKPLARAGDSVFCQADAHPEAQSIVPVSGYLMPGSKDTFCNDRGAIPADGFGLTPTNHVHAACPGSNQFRCTQGSDVVFVNDYPAVRSGDATSHDGPGPVPTFASPGQVLPLCSLDTFA